MTMVRARLIACALAVLACQMTALSAAPLALCRNAVSVEELDECCRNLEPGQTCPMHHTTHDAGSSRGPAWTCVCSPSDAVLVSLVGVSGALPAPVRLPSSSNRVTAIVTSSPTAPSRLEPPQSPPPRA